ncbi:hypothetical protein DRN75_02350 [Nanoarchaeota archaeon]|nr:MAG: hypothetical protein DRN75_02350 [Nanoarchaeota archaeon]
MTWLKKKGFPKPVKYIVVGKPNVGKSTLFRRTGLKVFETDSLSEQDVLNPSNYPVVADIIIVGGKWYHLRDSILSLLKKKFSSFHLILIEMRELLA